MGRNFGVKAPTTLKKAQLINAICDIKDGKVQPVFTGRGRPIKDYKESSKELNISVDKIIKVEKLLNKCKADIISLLCQED